MRLLKQSTAANVMVFMTDSADHVTGIAGLTLAITASKDGAAFAGIAPTVTDRGAGWYNVALTTAHTDTLGDLAAHATAAGADPTDFACRIVAGALDADVSTRLSAAAAAAPFATIAAALDATVSSRSTYDGTDTAGITTLLARLTPARATNLDALDAAISTRAATGAAMTLTAGAVDLILDEVIEAAVTFRQILRLLAAAAGGKASGLETNAPKYRDLADTKNRIDAVTDATGNRSAVTLDLA